MERREVQRQEGLVCIHVPPTQFLGHVQPLCQRGLKVFWRSAYLHVVCVWARHLRFWNFTLVCILTIEWRNWEMEHRATPGFLKTSALLTFWAGEFFAGGAVMCIVRCSAASLASTNLMLVAALPSGDSQKCPLGAQSPLVEDLHQSHWFG